MKRLLTWILPLLLLPLAVAVHARDIDEGIDYQRLSPPLDTDAPAGKVEVMEIFWYGCPHCYHLEPVLHKWLEEHADKVHFVRRPSLLNPHWEVHARAFYAAQALEVGERIHQPLFDAIHKDHRRLNDLDSLARFFAEQGVDEQAFRDAYNSFYVETQIRRERELAGRGFVNGVPAVVIDGQYFTDATIGGGFDGMVQVMSHLVDKVLAER
ncbi:thiol:disulfide interchange protein DsbA/DsbL [Endothiovibrio diazotrophicus]